MARISLTPPRTLVYRLGAWYCRRTYDTVPDPVKAYAHNTRVLLTTTRFELQLAKWNKLDPTLKALAVMGAATRIGCSWCIDFGYWVSAAEGVPEAKLLNVPAWRDSTGIYTDLELLVLEFAEAMTETVPEVTDEMAQALITQLGEPAFVELTAMIAVENLRSRVNSAFGLVGQGFRDRCATPAAAVASSA